MTASAQVTTDAVVLRRIPYRDADLVVTLLTRERGALSALARAARRSQRRFGPALSLFVVSRAHLREHRGGDLWTLSAADVLESHAELAADVVAMAHASYGTELVRELSPAEQPDEDIFELLVELYRTLGERAPSAAVLRAFELRLLGLLGLAPVLDRCLGCGAADPDALDRPGAMLDPGRGGVACAGCAAYSRGLGVRPLPGAARRLLVAAQTAPSLADAHAAERADPAAREARDALLAMILGHVGKPLRSLEFLAKLSGAQRRPDS